MRVRRSGQAGRDLDAVYDHSCRAWGPDRAAAYLRALDMTCQRLGEYPSLGPRADRVRGGYRRISHGRHVIYYRVHPDEVEIVRVLHQSMDAPRHLNEAH